MQAENITPEHNRTIVFADIPELGRMEVTLNYTHKVGSGRGGEPHILDKAIALDNYVIPYIIKAVNYLDMRLDARTVNKIENCCEYLKTPLEIRMSAPLK